MELLQRICINTTSHILRVVGKQFATPGSFSHQIIMITTIVARQVEFMGPSMPSGYSQSSILTSTPGKIGLFIFPLHNNQSFFSILPISCCPRAINCTPLNFIKRGFCFPQACLDMLIEMIKEKNIEKTNFLIFAKPNRGCMKVSYCSKFANSVTVNVTSHN